MKLLHPPAPPHFMAPRMELQPKRCPTGLPWPREYLTSVSTSKCGFDPQSTPKLLSCGEASLALTSGPLTRRRYGDCHVGRLEYRNPKPAPQGLPFSEGCSRRPKWPAGTASSLFRPACPGCTNASCFQLGLRSLEATERGSEASPITKRKGGQLGYHAGLRRIFWCLP